MKLLIVSLACLALLAGCGGNSPPTPTFEATVETKVAQEITDNSTPTLETTNAEGIKEATATPMPSATPTSVATPITGSTPETEPTPQVDKEETSVEVVDKEEASVEVKVNPTYVEQCGNATGAMVQQCMDQASALIEENPKLCETATGMMAFMCQNKAQESESTTHAGIGSGGSGGGGSGSGGSGSGGPGSGGSGSGGPGSGGSGDIANPCDKVAIAFRPQCEESIQSGGRNFAQGFDPDNIPKIAKTNFTELDKFSRMSKLRSVVGHDYSFDTTEFDPDGLSCRSMKHYFVPAGVPRDNMLYSSTPHTFEWMSIKFFAPTDGVIKNVVRTTNEYGPEAQFAVTSNDHPGYLFNYYHVKLLPDLDTGSTVTAGQQIGTLGSEDAWGEIAVQVQIAHGQNHLLSFLQVATDEVLNEYNARGLNTVPDVIITKAQRDANPIGCDRESEAGWFHGSGRGETVMVEAFAIWAFESTDNWFFFN